MGRGAGRLERAILKIDFDNEEIDLNSDDFVLIDKGISTEAICRAVYPEAVVIEKKHRVAVLQALHRIMSNPPRWWEDRGWTIGPHPKRGYWRAIYPDDYEDDPSTPSPQRLTAYHEAGHALGFLYFGHPIDKVVVRPSSFPNEAQRRAIKRGKIPLLDGFVVSRGGPSLGTLIGLLTGPLAEAHGKYPRRARGLSQTYEQFFDGDGKGDAEAIDRILADLSDDPVEQAKIRQRAQALAEALIRSAPGWRFIELLAEKLLAVKHGTLQHRSCVAIFRKAFGLSPPAFGAWNNHWPPTLARVRVGWLPPGVEP